MRHYSEFGFADAENAKRYAEGGPSFFVPGFDVMQTLTLQLIRETTPQAGRLLVIGAGGGLELNHFAAAEPGWRFAALDPSPEMIAAAREKLGDRDGQVDWIEGYIDDAPAGPFDAATCLLTLHLLPDDGAKLKALRTIRSRLKPGGAFALVDHCFDRSAPTFEALMDRYVAFARSRGVPEDVLAKVRCDVADKVESVSEEREVALLDEAGFRDVALYFAGLAWRGWIARG